MIDDCDDEFPFASGRYQVSAGLRSLRGPVFRVSESFDRYRANKIAARSERLSKYFQVQNFDAAVRTRVQRFISDQLRAGPARVAQIPRDFLDDEFDALAMQVEEDLAVMRRVDGRDFACAIHLCAPNHWSAEQRIGQSFAELHEPVAEIEPINRKAALFVDMMIKAEHGLTRTAWGIATDDQLNRHPDSAAGARSFDPHNPRAFVRIEDQTMVGFPDVEAALFVIRTRFIDCATLNRDRRMQLVSALRSMSMATLKYKGIECYLDALTAWLSQERLSGPAAKRVVSSGLGD